MLSILDYVLAIFHLSLTCFNVVGWIFQRTRKLHIITMSLTLGAWTIAGMWYGLGYCPLTDWHWDIKRKLGETQLPGSCIKYYADIVFQADFNSQLVDMITGIVMVLLVIVTLFVNLRSIKLKK